MRNHVREYRDPPGETKNGWPTHHRLPRVAEQERKEGSLRRSAHGRCARCGKRRKMWMRPNEQRLGRTYSVSVPSEGKVCWICRLREVAPTWRPGMPRPKISSAPTPPPPGILAP